jgi:uncharacterized protein (TIGR03435 family)
MRVHACLLVAVLLGLPVLRAQSAPSFEVASIRVNTNAPATGAVLAPQGNLWRARNVTIHALTRFAYGVTDGDPSTPLSLPEYQVAGGPDWSRRDGFDIEAHMPDAPQAPGASALMLRALLAERFGLRVHRETRELPVYALVRGNRDGALGRQLIGSSGCQPFTADRTVPVEVQCRVRAGFDGLTGKGVSMAGLASLLAPIAGRPVVDRTGLTGDFDFQLRYAADLDRESKFPSIFTAVREQLGLNLESTRAPIEVVVIDRVERPTENQGERANSSVPAYVDREQAICCVVGALGSAGSRPQIAVLESMKSRSMRAQPSASSA